LITANLFSLSSIVSPFKLQRMRPRRQGKCYEAPIPRIPTFWLDV
jgi:hypothetical protein